MALTLDVVRTASELDELAPQWWALWSRTRTATPFQTPAWLIPWWRAFAPGRIFTLAVRYDGELAGLAPFYIGADERARPIGASVTDYVDVLIDSAHLGPVLAALAHAFGMRMKEGPAKWELCGLAPHAQALALTRAGVLSSTDPCPVLELPIGSEGVASVLPARKKRKLRQARNRAERAGNIECLQATGADLAEAYRALVRLNALRRHEERSVLEDECVQRFHACALPLLEQAGMLDFSLCRMDRTIVGAYFGMRDRTRAYAYLGGFDPDDAFFSPGALLIGDAIERAISAGLREFHFLRGGERYKYDWGARDRMNSTLLIHARPQRDAA